VQNVFLVILLVSDFVLCLALTRVGLSSPTLDVVFCQVLWVSEQQRWESVCNSMVRPPTPL